MGCLIVSSIGGPSPAGAARRSNTALRHPLFCRHVWISLFFHCMAEKRSKSMVVARCSLPDSLNHYSIRRLVDCDGIWTLSCPPLNLGFSRKEIVSMAAAICFGSGERFPIGLDHEKLSRVW